MKRYSKYSDGLPAVNIAGNAYEKPASTLRMGEYIVVLDDNLRIEQRNALLAEIENEIKAESSVSKRSTKQEAVNDDH